MRTSFMLSAGAPANASSINSAIFSESGEPKANMLPGNTVRATTFCTFSNRSEEHTSELQSLMRISYAVFCLKKKKKQTNYDTTTITIYTSKEQHVDKKYN